ncbi:MAG: c-type cytochrome [Chloroflexi bacterium]|nr:c-type cytochrome [Chloroflexota bacterium]MBI3931199.1 c-type cytochrome [Chloroflexota bacterium]
MLSATAKWGFALILVLLLTGCADWSEFSRRVENPYPGDVAVVARGNTLYVAQGCAVCHGEKGAGNGPEAARLPVPPPDFTNRERMITRSDPDLFWAIVRGRERGQMPAYAEKLSENEIWDLVNYLRSLYQ